MSDPYIPIREAIQAGDRARARDLLRPVLANAPTAEAWYLAAQVVDSPDKAIEFCKRALAIDALHSGANRLIFKLEGPKPILGSQLGETAPPPPPIPIKPPHERKLRESVVERSAKKNRLWSRLGCFASILLSFSCSLFALNAVGLIHGVISTVGVMTGGPTPMSQYEGLPIREVPNAPAVLPASQSEPAGDRDTDILEDGYLHEYRFNGVPGQEYAIYIQFLSVSANRVSRNVAVVDPHGDDIASTCERNTMLQGDNNITLICRIQTNGTHFVRLLGRTDESTGAYFVGVEPLGALAPDFS